MAKLQVDYDDYSREVAKLVSLVSNIAPLEASYQKMVIEIIMLRLFDLFQETVQSVACKIICGAVYLDGTVPIILKRARSRNTALINMQQYNRAKQIPLRWSHTRNIKDNVRFVIDGRDPLFTTLDNYTILVSDMRRIRNKIAHSGGSANKEYREVILTNYGAYVNCITPGTLLLSTRFKPILISQYLAGSKILIKELVKA